MRPDGTYENSAPLLDRLGVVGGSESRVGAAVVDLHARTRAVVVRVGLEDPLSPPLRGALDLAVGAGVVPSLCIQVRPSHSRGFKPRQESYVDRVGEEAARRDARVDDTGGEHLGVGCGQDILEQSQRVRSRLVVSSMLTVIMAPEEEPVTKTLVASPLYLSSV